MADIHCSFSRIIIYLLFMSKKRMTVYLLTEEKMLNIFYLSENYQIYNKTLYITLYYTAVQYISGKIKKKKLNPNDNNNKNIGFIFISTKKFLNITKTRNEKGRSSDTIKSFCSST